jgi:hypothetical protein
MVLKRSAPTLKTWAPGACQVVGVDELVDVVALAQDRDVVALVDPLEEDLEDPQAAAAQDGPGPDDGDVQAPLREVPAQALAVQLGPAIVLGRAGHGFLGDRIARRHAEDGARGSVDQLPYPGLQGRLKQGCHAVPVDRPKQRLVLGQGHLGHVVVDVSDAPAGPGHRRAVANVAPHQVDRGSVAALEIVQIEDPDRLAPGEQLLHHDLSEVAGAAGHQMHRSPRRSRNLARVAPKPPARSLRNNGLDCLMTGLIV